MHCVAHKLELAALDSLKTDSYMRRFEETVKGIYMFYHYSPKRRREVKEVADFIGSELVHMSGIKQVKGIFEQIVYLIYECRRKVQQLTLYKVIKFQPK